MQQQILHKNSQEYKTKLVTHLLFQDTFIEALDVWGNRLNMRILMATPKRRRTVADHDLDLWWGSHGCVSVFLSHITNNMVKVGMSRTDS